MPRLVSRIIWSIDAAIRMDAAGASALGNMERELDSAESYAQIRKLADAAEALKILFRHVAEVKNKAELVVPQHAPFGKRPRNHRSVKAFADL